MELRLSRAATRFRNRAAWAGAGLLLSLAAHPAGANPVVVTAGTIYTDGLAFPGVNVHLEGPAISLTGGLYYQGSFITFSGVPWPGQPVSPGAELELDATVSLLSPRALLVFGGEFYQATGQFHLDTGRTTVDSLVTLPFTLAGTVGGCTLPNIDEVDVPCHLRNQIVELSIVGSGTVRAGFGEAAGSLLSFDTIAYEVTEPVPEPTTLLLMAAGMTALGLRRRHTC